MFRYWSFFWFHTYVATDNSSSPWHPDKLAFLVFSVPITLKTKTLPPNAYFLISLVISWNLLLCLHLKCTFHSSTVLFIARTIPIIDGFTSCKCAKSVCPCSSMCAKRAFIYIGHVRSHYNKSSLPTPSHCCTWVPYSTCIVSN